MIPKGEQMKKQMANIITSSRIICAVCLLFCPVFSIAFYILYVFCGITDMIDGTVARKTNAVSELGSKLDSIADYIFVAICLIKLLPILHIPTWLWIWIGLIAIIKIINIISGYIIWKEMAAKHTVLNKITGALLFVLPLTLSFVEIKYSGAVVCAIATVAAVQEGHLIRTGYKL